ncbi:MAG: phage major capsid protein [Mesorhizobium sp.]|uniref:phage major capsid protein n=1 Tax=Mesorhizobium sp. TaxID=1871066 RepID=UPI000FEA78BA|nr:phage major capsid protein [Mesorhizobium sp.]RWA76668.1 MAG: phage major capsid protein [Mesorhizobium sp.]RWC05072.1 MAG: phage major capsid protein [Mesorhizobium sp.]
MLESVKIQRRQSEIRQALAELVGKEKPTDDETRAMEGMDAEYRSNEARYRAALVAEDTERSAAKDDLEKRSDREYADLIGRFEMRQVALMLDEGKALSGPTAEVVQELRAKGGYRGVPVPWQALEVRVGETVASGTPNPLQTRPIIDRLFPDSVAGRMGAQMINIDAGLTEWPVVTSSVAAGWAATETGSVAGPTVFATTDKQLAPNQTLGITMKITRKALKQSGDALEQAVRRDMNGAIAMKLDAAVFQGAGSGGEPLGVVTGYSTYGITATAVNAAASWSAFRSAVIRFMNNYAVTAPGSVNLAITPTLWGKLDGALITNTAVSEWDRLLANIPASNISISANALPATGNSPDEVVALLTTSAGGVAPIFVGTWGAVDLIRDPYSDAASGGLRLTGLVTADVTVARPAQLELLTDIQ